MTNQPKLSARAQQALDILANGGTVTHLLERNSYTGREQFATRFLSSNGYVVKGLGFATHEELKKAGFSFRSVSYTSVGNRYKLNHQGA